MANNFNHKFAKARRCNHAGLALAGIFFGTVCAAMAQEKSAERPPATVNVIAPQPAPAEKTEKRISAPASNRARELNQRLQVLQADLDGLRTRYTELHPDVIAKKRQIRQVQDEIRKTGKR